MRELVKLPNQLLRQKSKPVKKIDSKIMALASEMVQFIGLHEAEGVSACQLGELVRVIAFRRNPMSFDKDDIQVVINPELVSLKGSCIVTEACFSVPGKQFRLRRAKIVKIRGLTLDNVTRSFRGHGLLAQIFQHEIDHLNGVLIDSIGVGAH